VELVHLYSNPKAGLEGLPKLLARATSTPRPSERPLARQVRVRLHAHQVNELAAAFRAGAAKTELAKREPRSSPRATPSGGEQSAAFKRCLQQVKALSERSDRPPSKDLSGRVWVSSPGATTVVVADRRATWTCNLKPDLAVSGAGKAAIADPEPNDFSLAYFWDEDGMFTWWGGGVLPAAAVTVKFKFPDGNEVDAKTKDGYWVMQYAPCGYLCARREVRNRLLPCHRSQPRSTTSGRGTGIVRLRSSR
jgi:hypothetical protein